MNYYKKSGFSLLEVLVAMAILSIMMVFLFNFTSQSILGWESGTRQVEVSRAARVGLDYMASELQYAIAGSMLSRPNASTTETVTAPFYVLPSASKLPGGDAARWKISPNSGMVFAIAPLSSDSNRLGEIGFFSAQITDKEGYNEMPANSFYLVMHRVRDTGSAANFYFKNTSPIPTSWVNTGDFNPLIPNCYSLNMKFFENKDGKLSEVATWPTLDKLPAGILLSIKVMDDKTASRVRQLLADGLSWDSPTVSSILQRGSVELSRFVPFLNAEI
jgi:prepilin-type N-terminal cleavage/methylation domain-containing protein